MFSILKDTLAILLTILNRIDNYVIHSLHFIAYISIDYITLQIKFKLYNI